MGGYEKKKKKHKILVMITDGEDLEGGFEKAVEKAKEKAVAIYAVGIGSKEGELIPIKDEKGKIDFMKDKEGNVVKTSLVEEKLQKAAIETGGIYVRATGAEFGLDFIYEEKLSKLEKEEFKSKMEKRYHEKFQFPLAVALLFLFVEPLIGERRGRGL